MNCPICQKNMIEQDFGGVKVDVCTEGCNGIWFDWTELMKLDEKNEGLGSALKQALNNERNNDESRGQINCPKCGDPMHIHKYQSSKEVNVDECYNCGGFFLDSGELQIIRDTFMSNEERESYADKLINQVPGFGQAQLNVEKDKSRAEAIKKYTKFIRASYYIAGE
ncbi:MAG: zf-TFIIB domain-containing protein [Candidatus Omnitrophota bacterium]